MKKYKICYYFNGNKWLEYYDGKDHREDNLPDYQEWYNNGMLWRKTYSVHDKFHNINGPADIYFHENGKIQWKSYCFNSRIKRTKLPWMNQIKNI